MLVLATDFSVWLMLFYVIIIYLHFVALVCCDGFARAALFCVVFLLPLAPLLVICVVVGLRWVLCVFRCPVQFCRCTRTHTFCLSTHLCMHLYSFLVHLRIHLPVHMHLSMCLHSPIYWSCALTLVLALTHLSDHILNLHDWILNTINIMLINYLEIYMFIGIYHYILVNISLITL